MEDKDFSFRWGIPWLDLGYAQVPNCFFDWYSKIGVTGPEFLFILHLARYKFESRRGSSRPSLAAVAAAMGVSRRQVQRYRESLVRKGLLEVEDRPGRSSEYSFQPFALAVLQRELCSAGHQPTRGGHQPTRACHQPTRDTHVTPTLDTHVTPPMTPMSPVEETRTKEEQQQQSVVVFSPTAREGEGSRRLLAAGVGDFAASKLAARYSAARISEVCEAALADENVWNKPAWIVAALEAGWLLSSTPARGGTESAAVAYVRRCAFFLNQALRPCPTVADGRLLVAQCCECPLAAEVVAEAC